MNIYSQAYLMSLLCLITSVSCLNKDEENVIGTQSETSSIGAVAASCEFSFPISKDEALKIVEPVANKYTDNWIDVSNEIIPAGTKIAYNTFGHIVEVDNCRYFNTPDFNAWLLVINNDPSVSGREKTLHFFVDVETGNCISMELDGRAIVEWDTSRNIYISSEKEKSRVNNRRSPVRSCGVTRWAVIIGGGIEPSQNYSRFYKDCADVYRALTDDLNYPKGNIFCLMSDGADPAFDQRVGRNSYTSSDPDLDDDGVDDVQYKASRANISLVFSNLSTMVSPGDEVLVFMTDHGDSNGFFYLWDTDVISPYQLDYELDKLGSSVKIDVVMGQCHSGAFVGPLSATNRTIATSCASTESAWTLAYDYNYFLHYWIEAISAFRTSGDGYVTPRELFVSAETNLSRHTFDTPQHPQYNSTPIDFGKNHCITGDVIPSILGSDYLSTNTNKLYTIANHPGSSPVVWTGGHNVSLTSSTDSTALFKGVVSFPGHFYEPATTVSATFVVDGATHTISKSIESVWKPGPCFNGNNICGGNGNYQVNHIGGEYGYIWSADNPAWSIAGQSDYNVIIYENYTTNPVNLIVQFYDPLGELIIVKDRVH